MRGVNKVTLVGHLGAKPEVKYSTNGTAVANLSIATNEHWTDKQTGEKREKTEWHRCVAFKRLAEICGEYLDKGSLVYVEGSLQTRKWTDKNQIERYSTEIVMRDLQMMGGVQQPRHEAKGQGQRQQESRPEQQDEEEWDDEIPF